LGVGGWGLGIGQLPITNYQLPITINPATKDLTGERGFRLRSTHFTPEC
jgi:hypothetical protein